MRPGCGTERISGPVRDDVDVPLLMGDMNLFDFEVRRRSFRVGGDDGGIGSCF